MKKKTIFTIIFIFIILVLSDFHKVSGKEGKYYWSPQKTPKVNYKISCTINPDEGFINGNEEVSFINKTGKQITRLAFRWLFAGNAGVKQELEIKQNGKTIKRLSAEGESPIIYELNEAIESGNKGKLEIAFSIAAEPYKGQEKYLLTDWHPRLWWGFETHDDYEVKIDLTSDYILETSGLFDNRTKSYKAENVRSFGLFAGKDFELIKGKSAGVNICCIFPENGKECAELILDTAIDVIEFYRERFGFYPYQKLTIVPGQNNPMGGWPIATNIVGIHGMQGFNELSENEYWLVHFKWITAHEIGHQYWGEYVIDRDEPAWLWIGLGVYADHEYSKVRNLSRTKQIQMIDRYTVGFEDGLDTTISRSEEEYRNIEFDFNNVVIHGKGWSIISTLNCVLGQEIFEKTYKRCLKEFGGGRMGLYEFRSVCEAEAGQDLGWFFEQWVNSNKYLCYEISGKECTKNGDIYKTILRIKRSGNLMMPVPVAAYFEDGTSQVQLTDRMLETNILEFSSKSDLKYVFIDPKNELAMISELSDEIAGLPWTDSGEKALILYKKASDAGMSKVKSWYRLGLMLYDSEHLDESSDAFKRVIKLSEEGSIRRFASLVWQGHIYDILGEREKALELYNEALKRSKKHKMTHSQYDIKIDRSWVEKHIQKRFVRN
ncbi:MAG: M1 family aminopeptidase [Planctomycetota bacterium]|jgi:tetratricopeptide (TPR) repeat protein